MVSGSFIFIFIFGFDILKVGSRSKKILLFLLKFEFSLKNVCYIHLISAYYQFMLTVLIN